MAVIVETFRLTSDNSDVFKAPSRLAAIPYNGILTIEMSARVCDSTNYFKATLQLPDGEVPIDGVHVPYNGFSSDDYTLHDETLLMMQFPAYQGGHFLLDMDETGDSSVFILATLNSE